TSAKLFLHTVNAHGYPNVKIGSLGGRFFGMDRDNRWDRVQKGYDAIVCATPKSEQSVADYIENAYAAGETDEFITPTAFEGYDGFKESDAVLMLNFRSDRMRELTTAVGDSAFNGFKREFVPTHLATITQYDKNFPYPVLFPKDAPINTLAEVVSKAGLRQLHTAETEKYAHVTFFFNGGIEEPYENETRVLIPSPQVKTYDMQPQMSAPEVGNVVLKAMDEGVDFVVVNFANGDMVGHTGNFEAAVKAVEAVDEQLGRIVETAQKNGYAMVLTSDHGNCEEMRDDAGNTLTNHTVGKVWCFVMADGVKQVHPGALNNVAPTVLKLMGLDIPSEMDGPLI
ncbi:MAG: phosphoglycerate mutase (2,3-diphosphoglycerate-independent), partial [Sulfuricurvum sp. RIFCSPHIGHO2_12_FULL_44_8]